MPRIVGWSRWCRVEASCRKTIGIQIICVCQTDRKLAKQAFSPNGSNVPEILTMQQHWYFQAKNTHESPTRRRLLTVQLPAHSTGQRPHSRHSKSPSFDWPCRAQRREAPAGSREPSCVNLDWKASSASNTPELVASSRSMNPRPEAANIVVEARTTGIHREGRLPASLPCNRSCSLSRDDTQSKRNFRSSLDVFAR